MFKLSVLIAIILSFCFPKINLATIINSNSSGGGDWNTSSSWIPAQIPVCGDTIIVLAGNIITLNSIDYSSCGTAMFIIVQGTMSFTTDEGKIKLPCGSGIRVDVGGLITDPNSDPDSEIEICNNEVWEFDNQGDVIGPVTLGESIVLPIELSGFEAKIDNTSVKLTWKTVSEINNDFFTIERSENGLNFEVLGEVLGNGNSTTIKEYSFFDDDPLGGTSYYRLKQTDFDGKYKYTDLITVNFSENKDGFCVLKVYPNPCVGSCTIDLEDCPLSESQINVELYDAFGKKIINQISPKSSDQDISFYLNTNNNLSPGVYIIRASANGKTQSRKVVVK